MMRRLDAGDRIGEYVLEAKIGEGSFGEVWRARHRAFDDSVVAIKIPRDQRALGRLRDEGLLARRVEAEGAVRFLGLDAEHDPPYLVLDYVEGESLRETLKRGPLAPERVLAVARRVFSALGAAHQNNVIHRDVKPENILIDGSGGAFLTDFGLASLGESGGKRSLASSLGSAGTKAIVGTLRYMSPEQKEPVRGVDERTDIYSAGLVVFEMLTGVLPEGRELPSDLVPNLDPGWDQLFRRCYARKERRLRSAPEALAILAAIEARIVDRSAEDEKKRRAAKRAAEQAAWEAACALGTTTGTGVWFAAKDRPAAADPNLIPWREARAILRVTDDDLERLVDMGVVGRVAHQGMLWFRRSDVVAARSRVQKVATSTGVRLAVMPPGRTQAVIASAPAKVIPAGPRPRIAAFAIDMASVFLLFAMFGVQAFAGPALLLAYVLGGPHAVLAVEHSPWVIDAASLLCLGFLYFSVTTGLVQRTFGKWLLGLKVVGRSGEELGLGRSAARVIGYGISLVPLGVGFLGVIHDPRHRGFHDILVDSMVVYE